GRDGAGGCGRLIVGGGVVGRGRGDRGRVADGGAVGGAARDVDDQGEDVLAAGGDDAAAGRAGDGAAGLGVAKAVGVAALDRRGRDKGGPGWYGVGQTHSLGVAWPVVGQGNGVS